MNKYKDILLDTASKLDALTSSHGEIITVVSDVIKTNDRKKTILVLHKISDIMDSNCKNDIKKVAQLLNQNLIEYYGYVTLKNMCNPVSENIADNRSLEELLEELNSLVGLESVKRKVNDLIVFQKVQKLRRENNLHSSKNTLHLAFTGNPGTGKTTVARIVGRIYKKIGLLSKGQFIEVSRTDLIAGYQGQTALKVKKVIEQAKGGVLFIDEAYSITENENSDSYGRECLTELTKALEDYRDDLVVIVAGYTEPMNSFFESNPGLKSRFNTFIEFPDYSEAELTKILETICKNNDYVLDENVQKKITQYLRKCVEQKDTNFANGRLVRNLYDDLVMNHARRVDLLENPTKNDLQTIVGEDFRECVNERTQIENETEKVNIEK